MSRDRSPTRPPNRAIPIVIGLDESGSSIPVVIDEPPPSEQGAHAVKSAVLHVNARVFDWGVTYGTDLSQVWKHRQVSKGVKIIHADSWGRRSTSLHGFIGLGIRRWVSPRVKKSGCLCILEIFVGQSVVWIWAQELVSCMQCRHLPGQSIAMVIEKITACLEERHCVTHTHTK